MKWWFTREIWWVEIKKTPLLNTSSDIQSLCITKNPFFLFSNLKIGLPCGVYMLYETKFYKKRKLWEPHGDHCYPYFKLSFYQ